MQQLIRSQQDIETFLNSQICQEILNFISETGGTLPNHVLPHREINEWNLIDRHYAPGWMTSKSSSSVLHHIDRLIAELYALVGSNPCQSQKDQRYGNLAFREWLSQAKLLAEKQIPLLLEVAAPAASPAATPAAATPAAATPAAASPAASPAAALELITYFSISFGNPTRLDYGTGHELNFLCFLYCLHKLELIRLPEDGPHLILHTFYAYTTLVRHLAAYYKIEPAGSRGVWGLDDYCFLPFLWGAHQLTNLAVPEPVTSLETITIKKYTQDYLYFDALNAVLVVSLQTLVVLNLGRSNQQLL